jgi:AN1-type zinc finger protein 1
METEEYCDYCKQVDFLLTKCLYCSMRCCSAHKFRHSCPGTLLVEREKRRVESLGKEPCSFMGCSVIDFMLTTCQDCNLIYCLKHRHGPDHHCIATKPLNVMPKAKVKIFIPKKVNPKVELMRLKLNAKGESRVAPESRLYCNLYLPQQKNELTLEGVKPVGRFFDMKLVVGKLVDILAAECNITNYNGPTDPIELSLFGSSIQLPMNETLGACIKSNLVEQGGNIVLHYNII